MNKDRNDLRNEAIFWLSLDISNVFPDFGTALPLTIDRQRLRFAFLCELACVNCLSKCKTINNSKNSKCKVDDIRRASFSVIR